MPVLVSLEALVSLPDSSPLWPQEFESLVVAIEADPNDKLPWGVAADWLCEDKVGETDLGEAFRWIHKREKVRIEAATTGRRCCTARTTARLFWQIGLAIGSAINTR